MALCIRDEFTRRLNMKTLPNNNAAKDLTVDSGADVSIGTQPVEERMQGDQIIETTD